MAFHNKEFPLTVGKLGAGARYSTQITVGRNGQESRNAVWQDALRRYNAAFSIKTDQDVETLWAFFHTVRGRHIGFYLKDWSDYRVYQWQSLHGVQAPNGVLTQWQLLKAYTDVLLNVIVRNITKPKQTTVQIRLNSVLKTEGVDYTVNYTTGIVTFTTPPAGGTTIESALEFFVPCRFDTDDLDIDMLYFFVRNGVNKGLAQIPDVPIVEIRDFS